MWIPVPSAVCPPCHSFQDTIIAHLPLKLKFMWFPHGKHKGWFWGNMSGMNPSHSLWEDSRLSHRAVC